MSGAGFGAKLANNNQLGIIIQANSGLPFNIRTNRDLNNDGNAATTVPRHRPQHRSLGQVVNVDVRYVRFIPFGAASLELFVEAKNLFNTGCSNPDEYATCTINISAVNRVVTTSLAGPARGRDPGPVRGHGRVPAAAGSSWA